MTTIVGADGCPAGWLCLFKEPSSPRIGSKIFTTVADLFAAAPTVEVLAIDIPIGLTEAHARQCDVAARKFLGPIRGTSVFPAPIRPALNAATHAEACEASLSAQQKKISKQAWMLYPKIRELDELLRDRPELRSRVFEVHPEVGFAQWNGAPIMEPKRSGLGFATRHALVARHFGADAFETVRHRYRRTEASDDDILDAFAALWSAERIQRGEARTLPEKPALDAAGLPMRIVY